MCIILVAGILVRMRGELTQTGEEELAEEEKRRRKGGYGLEPKGSQGLWQPVGGGCTWVLHRALGGVQTLSLDFDAPEP